MKGLLRFVVSVLGIVILFGVVGSVILDIFPSTAPLWENLKEAFSQIWGYTEAKYGVAVALVVFVFIAILIGTSN